MVRGQPAYWGQIPDYSRVQASANPHCHTTRKTPGPSGSSCSVLGGSFPFTPHPSVVHPVSPSSSSLHVPMRSAWNSGPVPGFRAPGPRRVDMPPDDDWRQSSYALPSRHRRTVREEFLFVLADAPGREQMRGRALQHSRW